MPHALTEARGSAPFRLVGTVAYWSPLAKTVVLLGLVSVLASVVESASVVGLGLGLASA